MIDLIDNILGDDNPFNDTVEDIFIDDDLFDNTDNKNIKIVADDILGGIKTEQEEIMSELPPPVIKPGNIGLNLRRFKRTNRLESAAARIKRKYQRQKQRKELTKINKKAAKYLKKAGYLDVDDAKTVDYSNNTNSGDVATIDYNNDNKDIQKVDLKKKSATIAAKKILTKYKNLKRKTTLKNYKHLNKDNNDDVIFIKQVPVHPKK